MITNNNIKYETVNNNIINTTTTSNKIIKNKPTDNVAATDLDSESKMEKNDNCNCCADAIS